MKKLNVIILDDEKAALEILSDMLIETGKILTVEKLNDPEKLESSVINLQPDAVFLDIEMPNYTGIEILNNLRKYRARLPVIFVTAHEKFAYEAAKNNPFSYMLKPVQLKELNEVIDRIISYYNDHRNIQNDNERKIKLPIKNGVLYITYKEIFSLTADGNYTNIKLIDGDVYLSSYNLGRLYRQLTEDFVRINRQTVVNSAYIKEISKRYKYCLLKINDIEEKLSISGTFLKNFNKRS